MKKERRETKLDSHNNELVTVLWLEGLYLRSLRHLEGGELMSQRGLELPLEVKPC